MTFLREKSINVVVLCILIAGAWFRLTWYGDLRLSIGHADTRSYVSGSQAPLFSWKIFAGTRLFTTNIFYKLANDEQKCPSFAFSSPSEGLESRRANQPCFDKIALLQNILAVCAWSFLAWMVARRLKNPVIKIVAATIIIIFAYTPQIAEWDSLLSPESLTFSLLLIAFALLLEIAFGTVGASDKKFASLRDRLLIPVFVVVYLLWVFVRDVHIYSILMSLILIAPLYLWKNFRQSQTLKWVSLTLIGFFILGSVSAKASLRATHYPLEHAFNAYIWKYPQRVEFIKQFDMPPRESPEFQTWFDANATKTYGLFLISHPGFVVTTLWDNTDQFKSDFIQPYFVTKDIQYRDSLIKIGEMAHPQTNAVFVLDVLFLVALGFKAFKYRNGETIVWFWLAAWFLLTAVITLVPTFFGDIDGTRRHIFPSVELLRLFMWIFLFPLLDYSEEKFGSL
jgi:hypothetical protein